MSLIDACRLVTVCVRTHPQVQKESTRQRETNLRARRLQIELAGAASGDVSEAALESLGPDVLSERVKVLSADLRKWSEILPAELLNLLQQLVTLLSTGATTPRACSKRSRPEARAA